MAIAFFRSTLASPGSPEPCRRARGQGQAPGFADIIIAATASRHQLTILTRNMRHFEPLGVPALNPFEGLPSLWPDPAFTFLAKAIHGAA